MGKDQMPLVANLQGKVVVNVKGDVGLLASLAKASILPLVGVSLGQVLHIPDAIPDLLKHGDGNHHHCGADPPNLLEPGRAGIGEDWNALRIVALPLGRGTRREGLRHAVRRDDRLPTPRKAVDEILRKGVVSIQEENMRTVTLSGHLHSVQTVLTVESLDRTLATRSSCER